MQIKTPTQTKTTSRLMKIQKTVAVMEQEEGPTVADRENVARGPRGEVWRSGGLTPPSHG